MSVSGRSNKGNHELIGVNVIDPVNFELSVPPNVNSPLFATSCVVGSNEIPISFADMVPWLNRLSVTVGIVERVSGDKVPTVKSTGPMPRIPSTPSKP